MPNDDPSSADNDVQMNAQVQTLLDEHINSTACEIAIVWRPAKSNPVTCDLRVNGIVLAADQDFLNSPQVFQLEPATTYVVDWGITPEIHVDVILIAIVNPTTKKSVVVDSNKNVGRTPWQGQKVINAP